MAVSRSSWATRALRAAARAFQFSWTGAIRADGHLLRPGSADRLLALSIWKLGFWGRSQAEVLERDLVPGSVVVDVGANIGLYTLRFARRAGPQGRVVAFEPDAENFTLLEANIAANGYANIAAVRKAVSDRTGVSTLYRCVENRGDHMLFNPGGWSGATTEVVALDDYFAPGERVDFIKIDIQGAEVLAFRGMKRVLLDNPQAAILCEFCPELLVLAGHDPRALLALWSEHGFSALWAEAGTPLPLSDPDKVLRIGKAQGYLNAYLRRP